MRELKFRGISKETGEFVYGHYMTAQRFIAGTPCVDVHLIIDDCHDEYIVNPETVGQLTGLRDRNGAEIYEGDICRDGGGNLGVIEWSQDECGWLWINPDEAQTPFCECTVIGNIYEHPHLLDSTEGGSDE